MSKTLYIFTDGACSGNPGEAGIGYIIKQGDEVIKQASESIGEATNNIAEYTAIIRALEEVIHLKGENVKLATDSELVFKQICGQYKVKHPNIQPLFTRVKRLAAKLKTFEITHIPREENKIADDLAKKAVKLQGRTGPSKSSGGYREVVTVL